MLKFLPPRSSQTVIWVVLAVGLIVLALGGYLTPFSRIILTPLVSAQTWLATRYQAVQDFLTTPSDVASLRQRNVELEADVANLQAEVITLQQQVANNQVLTTLLGFVQENPENEYVTAAVIGRDPSPFLHYVYINRGSDAGLRRGMPVVTQDGLVGRIAAVDALAARVQLINDTSSFINVRLQKTGVESVLAGQVTGDIALQMVPQESKVEVGDVVVTSGLGGEYPAKLIIGQVTNVRKRDYDIFQTASVQPAVDFARLNLVLVITNFRPVNVDSLTP
jgi:rod shape-determining protein MreC